MKSILLLTAITTGIGLGTTASKTKQADIDERILINASPEQVWEVLTDLGAYETWNPFIIKSEGLIEKGQRIRNVMLLEGKEYTFKPKLIEVREHRSFTWLGRAFIPGIMDGKHSFALEPTGTGQTRLIQQESFTGLIAGWFLKRNKEATAKSFRLMNEALKKEVESRLKN